MRVAVVGARFAGLDGVSLEAAKVAEALEQVGHEIVWYGGEVGPEFSPAVRCAAASFDAELNSQIQRLAFADGDPADVRALIVSAVAEIRVSFEGFLDLHGIDSVIVQNAWAIPMQLPLAIAITDVVRDRAIPTIGHHHDFHWERPRFAGCVVPEILDEYFPPSGDHIAHVVINTIAAQDLQSRRGLGSSVLPNVMDFERRGLVHDGGERFRSLVGIAKEEVVLLQPTRVIRRKGIELTVKLAGRLPGEPMVIVTHPDDLDIEYWAELTSLATDLEVRLRLVDAGRDRHSLASAYAAADLVCFPSLYEGFGNALVEAVYYRRPLMVNRYPVYVRDIAPLGFDFLELNGGVTDESVAAAAEMIDGGAAVDAAVAGNFEIGSESLSYTRAARELEASFSEVR
jgi:glycosyltransferase involved in cell wall biosynthesis